MANRQAIEAAFRAADRRLDRLAPLIATYESDRLLDDSGKWNLRDCLCHVAASARVSGMAQRALDRLEGKAPPPAAPGGPTVDERNQQQIEARAGKSVEDLVAEAKQGHAVAWEDVRAMTDATLDTKVPDMQPGRPAASVGGLVLRMLEYHEGGQMDRIENALRVRTRWV
jgi:DinB family protein